MRGGPCFSSRVEWRILPPTQAISEARERYLLLADISGYTAFLASVERAHGVDFSEGIPAGYAVIAALLDAVVRGVRPDFEVAKLEGDAVFSVAPAEALDGQGERILAHLRMVHATFHDVQRDAIQANDHVCVACPVAGTLRLKMVLHRGLSVRVTGGAHEEIHGPAVNVAHRLLKNTVEARFGPRPYLLVTEVAAAALGLLAVGVEHHEEYADVGRVAGRLVELDDHGPFVAIRAVQPLLTVDAQGPRPS